MICSWEEVSSLPAALRSFATHLSGPVPARNPGPDLLKSNGKSKDS
jgi:hypothetical protein